MEGWLLPVGGALGGLLLVWLALVAALWFARPGDATAREAVRLLPDLVRMLHRLAGDRELPRGVRIRLWLGLGYLLMPVDVVPDVVPVLGFIDDAVVVALLLRCVARRAGPEAIERHWPGSEAGLAAVHRLAGSPTPR